MVAVSRYIAVLCVFATFFAAHAGEPDAAPLSFSGKGNGPIQVTDETGTTNTVVSRPIAVVKPRAAASHEKDSTPAVAAESTEKTSRDESIEEMLRHRPKRDPNRLNTKLAAPRARNR
jgi:hypothetical protein